MARRTPCRFLRPVARESVRVSVRESVWYLQQPPPSDPGAHLSPGQRAVDIQVLHEQSPHVDGPGRETFGTLTVISEPDGGIFGLAAIAPLHTQTTSLALDTDSTRHRNSTPLCVRLGFALCQARLRSVRLGSALCQAWLRSVSGLAPLCVRLGSALCQAWLRSVSGSTPLCQTWFRSVSGLAPLCVRLGSALCQAWLRSVSGLAPLCVRLDFAVSPGQSGISLPVDSSLRPTPSKTLPVRLSPTLAVEWLQ